MAQEITVAPDAREVPLLGGARATLRFPVENDGQEGYEIVGRLTGPGADYATLRQAEVWVPQLGKAALLVGFDAEAEGRHELTLELRDAQSPTDLIERRRVTVVVSPRPGGTQEPEPAEEEPAGNTTDDPEPAPSGAEAIGTPSPSDETKPPRETKEKRWSKGYESIDDAGKGASSATRTTQRRPDSDASVPEGRRAEQAPPETARTGETAARDPKSASAAPKASATPPEEGPSTLARLWASLLARLPKRKPTLEGETPPEAGAPKEERESQTIRSPQTGDVLELMPGGRATVVVESSSLGTQAGKHVLTVKDDDRPNDDAPWVEMGVEQSDMAQGKRQDLTFDVVIPEGAGPEKRTLRIKYGPESGTPPSKEVRLEVRVGPRIAVGLTARREPKVVWFARTIDHALTVANQGTVGTAYRLRVEGPDERGGWRLPLDREEGDVGRSETVEARLRMSDSGIWWWGVRRVQTVRARAAPVTDPHNGGLSGNVVDVTGERRRLLPVPWPAAALLGLLLFSLFFGGLGVGQPTVENAVWSEASNLWLVLPDDPWEPVRGKDPPRLTARLRWEVPALALLREPESDRPGATIAPKGRGRADASRELVGLNYEFSETYRVRSILGLGGPSSESVVFLPTRTDGKLRLEFFAGRGGPEKRLAPPSLGAAAPDHSMRRDFPELAYRGKTRKVARFVVRLAPDEKLYLVAHNDAPGNKLLLYPLRLPKTYLSDIIAGQNRITQSQPLPFVLKPKGTPARDELWFATTDSECPILCVQIDPTATEGER